MSLPATAPAVQIDALAAEGGRAAAVTPALEAAFVAALVAARPDDAARLSAFNIEMTAAVAPGSKLRVRAWVERSTRTLAFVSGEVFAADDARVASGAGVFELQPNV